MTATYELLWQTNRPCLTSKNPSFSNDGLVVRQFPLYHKVADRIWAIKTEKRSNSSFRVSEASAGALDGINHSNSLLTIDLGKKQKNTPLKFLKRRKITLR